MLLKANSLDLLAGRLSMMLGWKWQSRFSEEQAMDHKTAELSTLTPAQQSQVIDRLFSSMATRYGKLWLDQWAGMDILMVKRDWAMDLMRFSMADMGEAMKTLPTQFPPSLPAFSEMCLAARKIRLDRAKEDTLRLERKWTKADMEANHQRMQEVVSKSSMTRSSGKKSDMLEWARTILRNPKNYPSISLQFAKQALEEAGELVVQTTA